MNDWLGLNGSRVLIAGAGGIGSAVAKGFQRLGADVTLVDSDPSRFQMNKSEPIFDPSTVQTVVADLLEHGSPQRIVDHIVSAKGGIDVFVHCIGVNDRRPILELAENDWQKILDVNLKTAYILGSEVGRNMVEQRSGRIVFVSSVAGLMAHRNHAPYATSKGGLNQLMRSMAAEWADAGVSANSIAPGYVETDLTSDHLNRPGVREKLESLIPGGHLGTVQQLVGPILFLSSKQAEFITGQVLYVDGGRSLV